MAVARKLGIDVAPDPALAEQNLSGIFSRNQHGDPSCRYNPNEPMVRQRFTVAHEIGHYVFGHKGQLFRDPKQNFSLDSYDPSEAACNRFAAELLMPELAVKHLIMEENIQDVRALADKFGVSEVAMQYRLADLGWIS
jgi:Zn-dependent peptidase ImmA (M78 family)